MKISWYGHACFLLESSQGLKLLTDPFDPQIGYPLPKVEVNLVTVSHAHFDHNAVRFLPGKPKVVAEPGNTTFQGISLKGIPTFHDAVGGRERGKNIVFLFEAEGLRFCHLGDLGHQLSPDQREEIGEVDVLFIPVGGTFTLDPTGAFQLVAEVEPKVAVPMHYHLPKLSLSLADVSSFTRNFPPEKVRQEKVWEVTRETIPSSTTVVVFELITG